MSFNARNRGGFRGGRGGSRGGGRSFRGGGRGGRRSFEQDFGPPESVLEIGYYVHPCEGDLVCKCTHEKIPFFNAPIYLENKSQIGKIDDVFGPMNERYFTIKLSSDMGASSFSSNQKFFIDPAKLLPLARFLPKPPFQKGGPSPKRARREGPRGGGFRGGSRGRGQFRGGAGGFRGRGAGGFRSRGGGGFRGRGGFRGGR